METENSLCAGRPVSMLGCGRKATAGLSAYSSVQSALRNGAFRSDGGLSLLYSDTILDDNTTTRVFVRSNDDNNCSDSLILCYLSKDLSVNC